MGQGFFIHELCELIAQYIKLLFKDVIKLELGKLLKLQKYSVC